MKEYNKYCCPIGKTRPTLEQMEEYIKQGKQIVTVDITGLEMEDKLSKIILDNSSCKIFLKDVDNGHKISLGPINQECSLKQFETTTIILDSYDEDKIKEAFDENMFIDVKNLNEDDIEKVALCLINYKNKKDELPFYIIEELSFDPRLLTALIESKIFVFDETHKIMKNSQDKKKKRDFRKLEFKYNNHKFR